MRKENFKQFRKTPLIQVCWCCKLATNASSQEAREFKVILHTGSSRAVWHSLSPKIREKEEEEEERGGEKERREPPLGPGDGSGVMAGATKA